MTVGKAIYYLLTNASDVTEIVGTRIFPEVAQQDADLPYIVYNVSNNEPSDTKKAPSKLDTADVEVNCFATNYSQVIDMGVAVRAALDRVKGTYSGVNVQSVQYVNEIIDFDEPQRAYNITASYEVRISRTDFEISQGSPITGVTLGELSDVNVTGVTDNQILSYDEATDSWIPADDAGGLVDSVNGQTGEVSLGLDDLTDVDAGQPEAGQLLSYGQGDWTTIGQDEIEIPIASVTNLQTELDGIPTELDDLSDVKIIGTPTEGEALVYQSGFFQLGQAGATELGDLDDVNTTGAGFGSLLTYNGATWDISAGELPSDAIYFHQRFATESEALRAGATATVELYFTCTAQGNGLAESASSDTPTAGKIIKRKIYYSEAGFTDPDTGTWVEFTPAPADDASFSTVKAALLEYLKARTGGTVPISLKQTWEEADEANLLLDTYTGAAAAYSLRKLRTAYTGDAVEVYNGSIYADIGFSNDELDTTALANHCGSNDGFVSKWYDQSSNTNTAAQTVTGQMPKIYDGSTGVVTDANGNPSTFYSGTQQLLTATMTTQAQPTTAISVVDTTGQTNAAGWFYSLGQSAYAAIQDNGSTMRMYAGSTFVSGTGANNTMRLDFSLFNGANSEIFFNGNSILTGNPGSNGITSIRIGGLNVPNFKGHFTELVLYPSDQDAASNRTGIETNINTFYSIY